MKLPASFRGLLESIKTRFPRRDELETSLDDFALRLAENDVAYGLAASMRDSIMSVLLDSRVSRFGTDMRGPVIAAAKQHLMSSVALNRVDYLEVIRSAISTKGSFVHMFIGVNGTGKTTTIAKVAFLLKNAHLKPLMVCADTFRAGAVEQFKLHAERVGVPCYERGYGGDPASVAYDAIEMSRRDGFQVVLIDTAGRFHTRKGLMEELEKMRRVADPDHITLVVDAMTGNDSWEQARTFMDLVGYDSIILTKFDADAKGGAALSVSYVSRKPIIFVGVGQGYEDLKAFSMQDYIEELFSRI